MANGDFVGCNVNGRWFVDGLQFVGVRRVSWGLNLESSLGYQSVLKGFELVSGLGISINPHFLEVATGFLACRMELKEFKFLVIMIGSNPRRINTWILLLEKFRRRLFSWNGRWVSFGGKLLY